MPVRGSLCLFWRKTHAKSLHARFPMRLEEDEGRQGPRAVNRREQSTEVRERRGARTCGPRGRVGQRARVSQRSWWLCRNFAWIHTHAIAHRCTESYTKVCLELTQVCTCLFFFSSTSRLCCVKKCENPLAEDKRNH